MTTLETALALRAAGVSVIPIVPFDPLHVKKGDKKPTGPWAEYQNRIPTEEELNRWFAKNEFFAVVGGDVLCIDFDCKHRADIFVRYCARAQEIGLDGLVVRLLRQRTVKGGIHLVFRCRTDNGIGNLKLASRPATAEEKAQDPRAGERAMIETRGAGGYFLAAPSPGYTLESGDWAAIPVITEEDRDALLELARSFDERPARDVVHHELRTPTCTTSGLTPGDAYDAQADVPALLQAHGWTHAHGEYWTRPGKARGVSASWDHDGNGRLVVFTTSSEFEPNHSYKPWHVFAILECGGDFARAAGELRRQGFGAPRPTSRGLGDCSPVAGPFAGVDAGPDDPPGVEGTEPADLSAEPQPVASVMSGKSAAFEAMMISAQEVERIRQLLRARAYDETREPPPLRPRFSLGGVVICTPGNLCAITAPVKVGKSALGSALIAATMVPPGTEVDTLSAVGFNADGKALIYFDTEQSPDDFWYCVDRAKRRARVTKRPSWLEAHTLAGASARDCRLALRVKMADAAEAHGGIHSVLLDGVGDLVTDVNDAAECNDLVAELHALAIQYDCSIICVIHKNPGSDKTRGHLGSQIERKSESNLSLEKEDEVTVIWSNKQRRAPIEKRTGPRFRWDDDLKMHVSVVSTTASVSRKELELHDMAAEAFGSACRMRYADLVRALAAARVISEPTAKRRVAEMRQHGVLADGQHGWLEIAHTTEAAA